MALCSRGARRMRVRPRRAEHGEGGAVDAAVAFERDGAIGRRLRRKSEAQLDDKRGKNARERVDHRGHGREYDKESGGADDRSGPAASPVWPSLG